MKLAPQALIGFLQDTLQLSADSIALACKQAEQTPNLLPMILWQYGLISLAQLDQIFDWLYNNHAAIDEETILQTSRKSL